MASYCVPPLASGVGKRVFYPVDALIARGLWRLEGQHVKSAGQVAEFGVLFKVCLGAAQDASLLAPVDSCRGTAEARIRPRSDLHEYQTLLFLHDQVDFAAPGTVVALQQAQPFVLQPVNRDLLESVSSFSHCRGPMLSCVGPQCSYCGWIAPPSNVASDNSRCRRNCGSMLISPVLPRSRTSGPACNCVKRVCSRNASAPSALSRA